MIKPLLRVLPSLSGNVKLACNITDARPTSEADVWEASVRGARILPISSQMWQSGLEAGLVSSSWEYDLPKFYSIYSDVFYKSCFEFDKNSILKIDRYHEQKVRANEFEFGVKRISYQKNGKQFAFFAPLYIDNHDDIPAYFQINAVLHYVNGSGKIVYAVKRSLRVNIGNEINYKKAYLGRYLDRYLQKIDDNVAFCTPISDQATFYGIDLRHGGFVTAVDNMMDRVYHYQNTIQNFDATIAKAFENNRIAMKQIIPLCFYFDVDDFLTKEEAVRYRNSFATFSGEYYSAAGKQLHTYDFSIDYINYTESMLSMNPLTGVMQWGAGKSKNIMDVGFPSLNESRYVNYEFANKLAPWFCRWKMKYSEDEHPYVMNNSWAFSHNQDSNYRYGQFPSTFNQLPALARYFVDEEGTYNYDMQLPLGDISDDKSGRWLYTYALGKNLDGKYYPGPYNYVVDKYEDILNGYCTNWFSVIHNYDSTIFKDSGVFQDVTDDCVYYKGILYDLRNIYNALDTDKRIDKFAVIVNPDIHILQSDELQALRFSDMTLYRQNVSQISSPNSVANDSILSLSYLMTKADYAWANVDFNTGGKVNQDEIRFDEIFTKNEEGTGTFIDMMTATYLNICRITHYDDVSYTYSYTYSYAYSKYNLDYYDLDKYYTVQDEEYINSKIDEKLQQAISLAPAELKKLLTSYVLPNYGQPGQLTAYTDAMELSYALVPVGRIGMITYDAIPEGIFDGAVDSEEQYVWALTHNDGIINVPPKYADREYDPDLHTAYLMLTDGFLTRHGLLEKEEENNAYYLDDTEERRLEMTNRYGEYYITTEEEHGFSYLALDDPEASPWKAKMIDLFKDNSYVRRASDAPEYLPKAWTTIKRNEEEYSYVSIGDKSSMDIDWGTQLYWNSYMLQSAYFPYSSPAFDAYSYLKDFVTDKIRQEGDIWRYEDLYDTGKLSNWRALKDTHPAAYYAGWISYWKNGLSNIINDTLMNDHSISEWEYRPIVVKNDNTIAMNVFNERSKYTGRFYGDSIPQSKICNDMDVMWADPYNLNQIYAYEGYPEHDGTYIPEGTVFHDMYVQFLNMQHLFYWYIELYKDADKKYDGTDDYTKFIQDEWYKHLYVVEESWIYDYEYQDRHQGVPLRRKIYIPLERYLNFPEYYTDVQDKYRSFTAFYNALRYYAVGDYFTLPSFQKEDVWSRRVVEEKTSLVREGDNVRFKVTEEPIKFRLCYKKKMARVDEDLWAITHMDDETADQYRDIYFYRLQSIVDNDAKYDGVIPVNMEGDMSYLWDELHQIDTYTYIQEEAHQKIIEGEPVTYYTHSEQTGWFDEPIVMTEEPLSYIQNSDSLLIPMFDDIFAQPSHEAIIYTHYSLHDIRSAYVVSDMPDPDSPELETLRKNFRFNAVDKRIMMEISPEEREKYHFVNTFDKYDECYSKLEIADDDIGFAYLGMSTKVIDGTSYGFYYIKSQLNNTSNAFKLRGISEDGSTSVIMRYVRFINMYDINKNPEYVTTIYKQIAPFINAKPLNAMSDVNTIIYPKTFSFDMIYSQVPAANGVKETEIIKNPVSLRTMSLFRYFHAMTPLIVPTTQIWNEWRLKLKNIDAQLLDTGKYISIGDAPIYSTNLHIDKFVPYAVYTKSYNEKDIADYNNKVEDYTPLEYKFYNASQVICLEPHVAVKIQGNMTYNEMLAHETDEEVMKAFKSYVKRTKKSFTEDELIFLLNKYSVSFDSVPIGLDVTQKEKLYTLSIVFDLL